MSNILFWAHQSTVDYNFRIKEDLNSIIKWFIEQNIFPKHIGDFERVKNRGLLKDETIDVTDDAPKDEIIKKFEDIRDYFLKVKKYPCEVQIGGNSAISAIRGYWLRQGAETTKLPLVYYAGIFSTSVSEALDKYFPKEIQEIFLIKRPINEEPQSIGIETASGFKLILIYGRGRLIEDIASNADFSEFCRQIEGVLAGSPPGSRAIFAINMPPLLQDYEKDEDKKKEIKLTESLIKQLREIKFADRLRIFVSTRNIPDKPQKDIEFAKATYDFLNNIKPDIISMNEDEAGWIHTAFREGKTADALAYKVRDLPFRAIKVCHSANGVIMDLGVIPEKIINSKDFSTDPPGFLEEVLTLSADGATYAMDATTEPLFIQGEPTTSSNLGRTTNEAMIRVYSKYVLPETRQVQKFDAVFLNVTEAMPAGMVRCASANVVRPRGALVGLGAIFDGLLLSFLMRN